ncbi:hypothetical protein [Chitinimonas naiadis]
MSFACRCGITLLLALLSMSAMADMLKGPGEVRELTNQVMAKVGGGDTQAGFRLAKPYLVISPTDFEATLDQIRKQQTLIDQRFGKTIGAEFISEEKLGESLIRIVQLQRLERHALRWSFYFYRNNEGWMLDTFRTDEDIRQFFP